MIFDEYKDISRVFIASIRPVAEVIIDGKVIGKTNVAELNFPSGSHLFHFKKGDKTLDTTMIFKPGKNPSLMIELN